MRTLKLLFTDKEFRDLRKIRIKFKFISLPILSRWNEYVKTKKLLNNLNKEYFIDLLLLLDICILSEDKDEELFQETKKEILSNKMINKHHDFKEWLINTDSSENDYSRVQEIINSYTEEAQ